MTLAANDAPALDGAPAVTVTPGRGCAVITVCYLAWIFLLGAVLAALLVWNARAIAGTLGRTVFYAFFTEQLSPELSQGDRAAFSNAYFAAIDAVDRHGYIRSPWFGAVFTNLVDAARDREITTDENAAFCSAVWMHVPAQPAEQGIEE